MTILDMNKNKRIDPGAVNKNLVDLGARIAASGL
jgi:hypothetical protein